MIDAALDARASLTIEQVQSTALAPGTPVSIAGVVVTVIGNHATGELWVEEPAGGVQSGVHIVGADPTVVAALQLGAVVSVTNSIKAEVTPTDDTSGRSEVELVPPTTLDTVTVSVAGSVAVPAPTAVGALAIGMMADPARSDTWRTWDGVVVTVSNVVQSSQVMPVPTIGSASSVQEFSITGVAEVESTFAVFPTTGLAFDNCLASVTGVVTYAYGYNILPLATDGIVVAGTSCPPPENTVGLCTDGIDNDGNGYTDCADDGCIVSDATCRAPTTIAAVDSSTDAAPTMPALPPGAPRGVQLGDGSAADVFITAAICPGSGASVPCSDFWVATSPNAGSDGGMFVHDLVAPLITSADIGKSVQLTGTLVAATDGAEALPQLWALALASKSATISTIVPLGGQTAAALVADASGRPYVGSLVTLTDVAVVSAVNTQQGNLATLQQGATSFEAEADIYSLTSGVGTCFSSITGIWTYDIVRGVYALEPTAEGTVTGASACTGS